MADAAVPGFTASPELEMKLAGLDDNLQPIKEELVEDEVAEDVKEETTEENEAVDESKEEQEDTELEEADADNEESSDAKDDEGYTIDDGDDSEDDEVVVAESKNEVQTVNRSDYTPEQQYILDNLKPITVRGYVGDSKELQTFELLSPVQLPDGFRYIDEKESTIANLAFNSLDQRANELQNEYRAQETNKSVQAFKELEDNSDRADINELQKEGELPKFKTAPNDPKFESDPATVEIQAILDFKEAMNNRYMEEYNAGRPYRHIGFMEAYAMYRRQNPKVDPKVQAEDNERKGIARRTANTKSRSMPDKPKVTRGMSSRDLDLYLESLDI